MSIVLVTGANRSIGLETAKQLLQRGHFVYLGSRDLSKGNAVVATLAAEGFTQAKAIQLDVTDPVTITAAAATIEKEQGKLDILINNAGISNGFPEPVTTTPVDDIKKVFDTNFYGAISVTKGFLGLLKKSQAPRISNITSGLGSLTLHTDPTWKYYGVKLASYVPSKAALNAFTILLAYELRELPFKVNAIDPGYTATDFNHHSGPGSVEDAAAFVVKHTDTGNDAPTGCFFSKDIEDGTEISAW